MGKLRVITRDNAAGLSRDLWIVADALRAQHRIVAVGMGRHRLRNLLRQVWSRVHCAARGRFDAQLSLERIYVPSLGCARRNLLMPNPEWFRAQWIPLLPRFERVLCKTRHAEAIFSGLGCATVYTGLTSSDRLDPQVPRTRTFLHLAGRSFSKGTRVLLETWRRHPQWPCLTVVQSARNARPCAPAPNIVLHTGHLDDAALQVLQNAHRFHLCPSEAEGFGHSIAEAMSVGAVVLTTDAAPMNELVTLECGLLLEAGPGVPMGLALRHTITPCAIEAVVQRALQLDEAACARLGAAARQRFLERDAAFRTRLSAALADAVVPLPAGPCGERGIASPGTVLP